MPILSLRNAPLRALARVSQLVPSRWHAEVVAKAFNTALALRSQPNPLLEVSGVRFAVVVDDLQLRMQFELVDGRLRVLPSGAVDVVFSGRLLDLFSLASGLEDPDTLFFQRRVAVQGATDTGVHLKNALDALGFDVQTLVRRALPTAWAPAATRHLQSVRDKLVAHIEAAAKN